MKNLFFTSLLMLSFICKGLAQAVIADPAVNLMRTSTLNMLPLNPLQIPIDSVVELKVPIINYNLVNALPPGTCKILIGLGSKMVLDPAFNLNTINTGNYFHWTAQLSGGQIQITGDLIATLPRNFADTVTFQVKGTILGSSTVTTNFLITNHNTTVILSDENGANNTTALLYNIIERQGGPLPVNFTDLTIRKQECTLLATVFTQNEINVDKYELEISADGTHFITKAVLPAANLSQYRFLIVPEDSLKNANYLFLRVKSTDLDGRYQYSMVKKITGGCNNSRAVSASILLYPNPLARQQKELYIRSEVNNFNGNYVIKLYGANGQLIDGSLKMLNNVKQFSYDIQKLPAGQYLIQLSANSGVVYKGLRFQIL